MNEEEIIIQQKHRQFIMQSFLFRTKARFSAAGIQQKYKITKDEYIYCI